MSKFKKLLAGMLTGVSALACVAMVGNVNAASYEYGSMTVTTTNNVGDTKTWDFSTNKPSSNQTLTKGDDALGIIVGNSKYESYTDKSKGLQTKSSSIKSDGNGLSIYGGGYVYVPVPSADSAGNLSRTGSTNTDRYVVIYKNDGTYGSINDHTVSPISFTSTNVFTDPEGYKGYYLKLAASNASSGTNDTSSAVTGELKTKIFSITLSNGSYGEAATQYDVTYMDGTTTLNTEKINENSKATYSPKKYGYDFEGWYTTAELTTKADLTITANTVLYAKWTAWDSFITNNYELTQANIAKISTGIDGSLTADLQIAPSIYTYMKGGAMTTTGVTLPGANQATQAPCFNTGNAVSTSGNGLKFTAPANGTLTVYIGCGGGSARNAKLTDGTNDVIPTQGADALIFDGTTYEPISLTFELVGGTTYYLGGTSGVRIYYVSFAESAAAEVAKLNAQFDNDAVKNAVRFIGTIVAEDLTKVTDIKITLTLSGNDTPAVVDFTTVYTSVSHLTGFGEAENTYYIILKLTNLEAYRTSTLNATLSFKIDGVEHSASLAEALSLAV